MSPVHDGDLLAPLGPTGTRTRQHGVRRLPCGRTHGSRGCQLRARRCACSASPGVTGLGAPQLPLVGDSVRTGHRFAGESEVDALADQTFHFRHNGEEGPQVHVAADSGRARVVRHAGHSCGQKRYRLLRTRLCSPGPAYPIDDERQRGMFSTATTRFPICALAERTLGSGWMFGWCGLRSCKRVRQPGQRCSGGALATARRAAFRAGGPSPRAVGRPEALSRSRR